MYQSEEVTDAMSQRREKQIMVEEKEIKDQEKEKVKKNKGVGDVILYFMIEYLKI